ncbi:30S ribosome-binding factor RbfA [Rhodospirillum centenum]|uniref:Ribosome-binding factor A n=1 Tax=Rhodospirillum centenum (strain ATCC 51521 / SW) TaxID=414684 RepID=B6IVF9_RHOCS|nr:30S ribosome-binding factor RbfA [Rhodospirillum centenum]ACJ00283.1 ribosome-binding factor A [Rhodospirillum centenum SW]
MSRGRGSTKPGNTGPSQRQLRVGEEIRHALADILRRGDFRDPGLQDVNVTVTEVRVSPDLKNATAFVMPLGGGHPEVIAALNHAAPFFRAQIAHAVRLQHAPRIGFQEDTSFAYADRIDRLLHDPAVARDITRDLDAEGVPLDRGGAEDGEDGEDDDDLDAPDAPDLDGGEREGRRGA